MSCSGSDTRKHSICLPCVSIENDEVHDVWILVEELTKSSRIFDDFGVSCSMQLIAMDVWYQVSLTSLVYGKMVLNHGRFVLVSKTT